MFIVNSVNDLSFWTKLTVHNKNCCEPSNFVLITCLIRFFLCDRSLLGVQTFPTIHEEEESKDDREDGEISSGTESNGDSQLCADRPAEDMGKRPELVLMNSWCCRLS